MKNGKIYVQRLALLRSFCIHQDINKVRTAKPIFTLLIIMLKTHSKQDKRKYSTRLFLSRGDFRNKERRIATEFQYKEPKVY